MKEAPLTSTEIRQLLDDLALPPEFRHRLELLLEATLQHEREQAQEREARLPYRDD